MRVMAAVVAFVAGEAMDVSRVCRDCGVSRKTFYKYVARCRAEGLAGFEPRSRRPGRFPGQVASDVEEAVVRLRKQLAEMGVDHGATTIQWHLGKDQDFKGRVPSVATVHRVLVRRGFVVPQPQKRPKASWRRFEASLPNDWWQIDATDWVIAVGVVKVFNIVDDHSRVACRSRAVSEATSAEAWTTFCEAGQVWGLPAGCLSDNGLCFSSKLRGVAEVLFEANLRDAGIRPMNGRAFHPQTTGKVERFQQTLKRWLRQYDQRAGLARDLVELQQRLDEFCTYYNEQRPHQGIGRVTPITRWKANTPAMPGAPLEHRAPRPEPTQLTVGKMGVVHAGHLKIGVGMEWAGWTVTVLVDAHYATIFTTTGTLIRHLRLDHTRSYQPSGQSRGRRPGHHQLPS